MLKLCYSLFSFTKTTKRGQPMTLKSRRNQITACGLYWSQTSHASKECLPSPARKHSPCHPSIPSPQTSTPGTSHPNLTQSCSFYPRAHTRDNMPHICTISNSIRRKLLPWVCMVAALRISTPYLGRIQTLSGFLAFPSLFRTGK